MPKKKKKTLRSMSKWARFRRERPDIKERMKEPLGKRFQRLRGKRTDIEERMKEPVGQRFQRLRGERRDLAERRRAREQR